MESQTYESRNDKSPDDDFNLLDDDFLCDKSDNDMFNEDSEESNEILSEELGNSPVANLGSDSSDNESDTNDYTEQCFKRRPRNFKWPLLGGASKLKAQKSSCDSEAVADGRTQESTPPRQSYTSSELPVVSSPVLLSPAAKEISNPKTSSSQEAVSQGTIAHSPLSSSYVNGKVPHSPSLAAKTTKNTWVPAKTRRPKKWAKSVKSKVDALVSKGDWESVFKILRRLQGRFPSTYVEWPLLMATRHAARHDIKLHLDCIFQLIRSWTPLRDQFCSKLILACSQYRQGHVLEFMQRLLDWWRGKNTKLSIEAVSVLLNSFKNGELVASGGQWTNPLLCNTSPGKDSSRNSELTGSTSKKDSPEKGEVENINCVLQNISASACHSTSSTSAKVAMDASPLKTSNLDVSYLEKIKMYVSEDCWGRLRELLTFRGHQHGELSMVEYIYKALCAQGNIAGSKFRAFVCMVTMNGKHELHPHLVDLLSRIGVSIILESHAVRMYDVTVSVLSTLCDYHISFFSQKDFETCLGEKDTSNVIVDPSAVFISALESCIQKKNRNLAVAVLKECNWAKASSNSVDPKKLKAFLWKRFHLLIRLADLFLDNRALLDGSTILKTALDSLFEDLDHPLPEENISRDLYNLYNDYMEALINTPECFDQLKLLIDPHIKLEQLLNFDGCVLRGLVAILTRNHELQMARGLFQEGCLKSVYCIPELPENSCHFDLPIPNYFVIEEIRLTIEYFLKKLASFVVARQCTVQQLQVNICIQDLPAPDIGCVRILRLGQATMTDTRQRILAAACSYQPQLKLNPHISGVRFAIETKSLEQYLKQVFGITFPLLPLNFPARLSHTPASQPLECASVPSFHSKNSSAPLTTVVCKPSLLGSPIISPIQANIIPSRDSPWNSSKPQDLSESRKLLPTPLFQNTDSPPRRTLLPTPKAPLLDISTDLPSKHGFLQDDVSPVHRQAPDKIPRHRIFDLNQRLAATRMTSRPEGNNSLRHFQIRWSGTNNSHFPDLDCPLLPRKQQFSNKPLFHKFCKTPHSRRRTNALRARLGYRMKKLQKPQKDGVVDARVTLCQKKSSSITSQDIVSNEKSIPAIPGETEESDIQIKDISSACSSALKPSAVKKSIADVPEVFSTYITNFSVPEASCSQAGKDGTIVAKTESVCETKNPLQSYSTCNSELTIVYPDGGQKCSERKNSGEGLDVSNPKTDSAPPETRAKITVRNVNVKRTLMRTVSLEKKLERSPKRPYLGAQKPAVPSQEAGQSTASHLPSTPVIPPVPVQGSSPKKQPQDSPPKNARAMNPLLKPRRGIIKNWKKPPELRLDESVLPFVSATDRSNTETTPIPVINTPPKHRDNTVAVVQMKVVPSPRASPKASSQKSNSQNSSSPVKSNSAKPAKVKRSAAELKIMMFLKSRVLSKYKQEMSTDEIDDRVNRLLDQYKATVSKNAGNNESLVLNKMLMKRLAEFAAKNI